MIEEQPDRLQSAKILSAIDLPNGFFHVSVDKDSCKFIAFVTPVAQYEFVRVPFGLCISLAVFQRFINTVFGELIKEEIMMAYFDDIIILTTDAEEAMDRLSRVLSVSEQHGLQIS